MGKGQVTMILRIVLGLIYFVFGLNGFLQFIPMPPLPEPAMKFMMGMVETGYMLPSIKITEIVVGALLIVGLFVPLALVIAAPITLQIFLFHFYLTPGLQNSIMPIAMIIIHVLLGLSYMAAYKPMLKMK